jgi:mRNA deadenylase 3'-5' endonuclease subunit Ccr4
MRSAYQVHCGFEPKFTNWAKVKSQEPFIDTLDYIFLSPHWKVQSVLPLPELSDVPGPMPTAEEPSDHLLISAEITI